MKKLSPFRTLSPFRFPTMMHETDFNNDVEEFIRRFWDWKTEPTGGSTWMPSVDVLEKPDMYLVFVEAPGLEKNDVQLELNGDTLTIRGERKREEVSEDDHFRMLERYFGKFERNLTLPMAILQDGIDADLHNGILKITLKKTKAATPTKIKIKAH